MQHRRGTLRHRVALDVTLHVGGGGRALRGRATDLSRSGVFVTISENVPKGQRVEIVLDSPKSAGAIAASGIVVYTVAGAGVGVRFSHQNPRTREAIGKLIEELKVG